MYYNRQAQIIVVLALIVPVTISVAFNMPIQLAYLITGALVAIYFASKFRSSKKV